jgi:hypothetical protein
MMRVLILMSCLLGVLFLYAQFTTAHGETLAFAQCAPAAAAPPPFTGRASHTNGMSSTRTTADA